MGDADQKRRKARIPRLEPGIDRLFNDGDKKRAVLHIDMAPDCFLQKSGDNRRTAQSPAALVAKPLDLRGDFLPDVPIDLDGSAFVRAVPFWPPACLIAHIVGGWGLWRLRC